MATLHDTLWNLTVDNLRYRLKFLVTGTKATRKAELIDRIKAALSGPAWSRHGTIWMKTDAMP